MADPLSISASVIAVVGAGIKVSIGLFTLVETVSTASRRVEAIANDIQSTCGILDQLSAIVKAREEGRKVLNATALGDLEGELRNCRSVFREIERYLRRATKQVDGIGRPVSLLSRSGANTKKKKRLELSKSEKAKWPFLQEHFGELRSDLMVSKQNLTLMIVIANYKVLLRRMKRGASTHDQEEEKENLRDQILAVHRRRAMAISRKDTISFESESEQENAVRKLFRKMGEWRRREKPDEGGNRALNEKDESDGEGNVHVDTAQDDTNTEHSPVQRHETILEVNEDPIEEPANQNPPGDASSPPQPEVQKPEAVELEGTGSPGVDANSAGSGDVVVSMPDSESHLDQPGSVEPKRHDGQNQHEQHTNKMGITIVDPASDVREDQLNPKMHPEEAVQLPEAPKVGLVDIPMPGVAVAGTESITPSSAPQGHAQAQVSAMVIPRDQLLASNAGPSKPVAAVAPVQDTNHKDENDDWGAWSWNQKQKKVKKKKEKKRISNTELSFSGINVVAETIGSPPSEPTPSWGFSGTTMNMSKEGKRPVQDSYESDVSGADNGDDEEKVLGSTTGTFHVEEEKIQELLRAWTTGATPGMHDGRARALTINELRLRTEDIQALLDEHKGGAHNPFKSIFKLNAYQRRIVLEHVAAIDSTLLFVDVWGQEQMSTVFGEVEIAILMWVTASPADKEVHFDSDAFLGNEHTARGLGGAVRSDEQSRRDFTAFEDPVEQRLRALEMVRFEEEARRARQEAVAKSTADDASRLLEAARRAREEAEERAARAAAEAKMSHEKALAEARAAAEELEKAKKVAEEEAAKLKPSDAPKPPIKFKDAVGRKFSFPWHLVKTWKGMEELIKQAFLHVDVIGPHVHEGHYDLVGPDGEIILPLIWESIIQPDMAITMHMWPMPEPPPPPPEDPGDKKHRHIQKDYGGPPPPPPPPPAPGVTTVNVPLLGKTAQPRAKKKQGKTKVDSWMTSIPPPPPPPPPSDPIFASRASAASASPAHQRTYSPAAPPPNGPKIFTPPPPPLIWDIPNAIVVDSPKKKRSKAESSSAFMKWAAGAGPGPSEKLRTHGRFDKMYDDSDESVLSSARRRKAKNAGKSKKEGKGTEEGEVDVVEELLTKWTDEVD